MPLAYAVAFFMTCCCSVTALVGLESKLGEGFAWLVLGGQLTVGVFLIGYWNRGIAGRWASRMTRTPVYGGMRSGGWYWATLLALTATQLILTFLYPVIGLGLLGTLFG